MGSAQVRDVVGTVARLGLAAVFLVDEGQTAYGRELLRDAGFLLLAGWLIVRPRTFAVPGRQKERV